MIELTKGEMESLVDFIEFSFIDSIRNDEEIDNLGYVSNICKVHEKCKRKLEELKGVKE